MNNLGQRKVALWSIDTPISGYGVPDALPMSANSAAQAANMRTRLNPFKPAEIELLLQAGYAGADASLRAQGLAANSPVVDFANLPSAMCPHGSEPCGYPRMMVLTSAFKAYPPPRAVTYISRASLRHAEIAPAFCSRPSFSFGVFDLRQDWPGPPAAQRTVRSKNP